MHPVYLGADRVNLMNKQMRSMYPMGHQMEFHILCQTYRLDLVKMFFLISIDRVHHAFQILPESQPMI